MMGPQGAQGSQQAKIELAEFVTRKSVEHAYGTVKRAQREGIYRYTNAGRRAAKARDPKLLLALEKGAMILQQISEEQAGPHGFDVGGTRVQHTEFQLWRNAYAAVDAGRAEDEAQYMHFYGMAALLAGLV